MTEPLVFSEPGKRSSEAGQGLVEYALILVLFAIFIIVTLVILAPRILDILQIIIEAIHDASRPLQIALIVIFLIPILAWLIRLAPQLPKVLRADVRQLELAEHEYERIETQITAALLRAGKANRKDVDSSPGLWGSTVRRYIMQHRDAQIHYDERRRTIVATNADALNTLDRLWNRLSHSPSHYETDQVEVDQVILEILDLLAQALTATVKPAPQDALHGMGRVHVLDLVPWDSPFPSQLPILVWLSDEIPDLERIEQLSRQLLSHFDLVKRIALWVKTAGDESERQKELHELLGRLRQVLAYDFVPLGYDEIAYLLIAKRSRDTLVHLMLPYVNLVSISPFVLTGPAADTMFFGRELEIRNIAEHIAASSYALVGGRRFGKSSVLLRLHRVRLPVAGFRTLYHDCSITPTCETFFAAAIREWRPEPPLDVPATFGDLLQSPLTDKPLVLLLDEADKLVPADRANGWPLFNALRALASSGRAQVVLSGERTLRDVLRDSTSPLFNFANEMLLGPLDFRAVEELVTRPMKQLEIELVNEKAIVDRIWAFTSGHPNVVQRLCRRLIERLNEQGTRRITLDDVNAIIEDPAFQRDDFLSTYWEATTSLEKIISLLMADDENVRTLRAVRQALAERCDLCPKARQVDDALQRLVDLRSILKRTPTGYEFAVKAFPRVVAGTMTLQDMLEVLVEDYAEEQAGGEA